VIVQVVIMAGVPVAFALSVLRGGFARTGELDELTAWLGSGVPDRPPLAAAVGQALGDPTVTVGYTIDGGPPVDAHGERVLPRAGARGYADVELDGRSVATISYDAELITDPEHVAAAGRIVAIQLDRDRLTAELLAGQEALRDSRVRIVTEADRERRRIAQDLHDGMQAELVVLSLVAGRIAADDQSSAAELRYQADELRRDLDTTAADLRRLVHGLMPAILVERGLFLAARAVVDALPLPTDLVVRGSDKGLPQVVETTGYFVLAEALTNAVRYAEADHISVSLARTQQWLQVEISDDGIGGARPVAGGRPDPGGQPGSSSPQGTGGLWGLTDRVAVLGGRLVVESLRGSGTRVLAEIPCVP
jgi:signal transduction histidine kinase